MHSVATTEALNESCNLSLSWTLLTKRRDYLPVKPSEGTCMSAHYKWFNLLIAACLEVWSGKHTINLRLSTFLYAMGKALRSQSPPPPPDITTAPTLYRAFSID